MDLRDLWPAVKQTVKEYGEDKVARHAAALSYYTLFSVAPVFVLILFVVGLFLRGQNNEELIINQVQQYTGPGAADAVRSLVSARQSTGTGIIASVVGLVTLLMGATGLLTQLEDSLNTVWGVPRKKTQGILNMFKSRGISLLLIIGMGIFMVLLTLVSTVLSAAISLVSERIPGSQVIWEVVNFAISTAVLTLIIAVLFKVLPEAKIAWKDVWFGALVTAVLFNLGRVAIGYYLGMQALEDSYGAAGSLIAILLWVYYSSQILLLGAEFTQVWANRGLKRAQAVGADTPGKPDRALVPVTGVQRLYPSPDQPRRSQTGYQGTMEPAGPSMVALSAIAAGLAGFLSGWFVRRGNSTRGKRSE